MKIVKRVLSILIRIGISAALLIFLFRQVDKKSLFEIIQHSNKPLLLLALIISSLGYIFAVFRWGMLLKAIQIHLPFKRIIISFAGGAFFNLFLPSTIGGDLMRSIDLASHTRKTKEVLATVLLDRLSGYVGLVILASLALSLGWGLIQDKSVVLYIAIIAGILISILLVLFNNFVYNAINKPLRSPNAGKIRDLITNLHQEIHIFRHHKTVIVKNIILSILIQSVSPLAFYITALSIGAKINIVYFFIFLPVIGAITLLPISIGGLGLRDATVIFFFAKVGLSRDLAFAMSLLNFFFIIVYGSLGGLIYVLTVRHRRLQYHKSPAIHPKNQQ